MSERIVLVVGGGASGALFGIHLARLHGERVRLLIVDPAERLARGVAFSTERAEHILNIPAGQMSAFESRQSHFCEWLWESEPAARVLAPDPLRLGPLFVPRSWFGRYLEETFVRECRSVLGDRFTHLRDRAVGIEREGDGWALRLRSGRRARGEAIVLALGNFQVRSPLGFPEPLLASERWIDDCWDFASLDRIPAEARVGVLGTGLSMADVYLTLLARGHRGPVTAISRRGLIPLEQKTSAIQFRGPLPESPSVLALLQELRSAAASHAALGGIWQDTLSEFRHQVPRLWSRLPESERRRFLRHLKSLWEVHRHRLPPQSRSRLTDGIASGQLQVRAAHIDGGSLHDGRVMLRIRPRGVGRQETLEFDYLVNAMGPDTDFRATREPLLRNIREQGYGIPDPLALGFRVTESLELIGSSGVTPGLYALGSLVRSRYWDSTAVPNIRCHAGDLARRLAGAGEVTAR